MFTGWSQQKSKRYALLNGQVHAGSFTTLLLSKGTLGGAGMD